MHIKNLDISLAVNLLPAVGMAYLLFLVSRIIFTYITSGGKNIGETFKANSLYLALTKAVILTTGCLFIFFFLEKKTLMNYFYLVGLLFVVLYILGELVIEISLNVIFPLFHSIAFFKKLMTVFFDAESWNRKSMKLSFVILTYSLVMIWLVIQMIH